MCMWALIFFGDCTCLWNKSYLFVYFLIYICLTGIIWNSPTHFAIGDTIYTITLQAIGKGTLHLCSRSIINKKDTEHSIINHKVGCISYETIDYQIIISNFIFSTLDCESCCHNIDCLEWE